MLKSILLGVTGAGALVLRRGDVEAITQGELDATGIVVLHFLKHHPIAVKHNMVDAAIEEVVACQFDIETVLEEVFTDTKRKHWVGTVNQDIRACIAVSVHIEVGL